MSVATLENGNLTLGNLTVNNSQYAEASGYVASQIVLASSVNTTNLTIPTLTASSAITTPQITFDFGTINGTAGNACNITSNGLALFTPSNVLTLLTVGGANNLTIGNGTTTGTINTSQVFLPSTTLSGADGSGLNIIPDNGTINLFSGSGSGASSVPLSCTGVAQLTVGNGTTTGVVFTTQGSLPCGTLNGTTGGALNVITDAGLALFSTISGTQYSGTLSVSATGALLWNGVQIS
jgi:hypothetical protein